VVTHQLQVERRTAKARQPKTDVIPLDHATSLRGWASQENWHCIFSSLRLDWVPLSHVW